MSAQTATRFGTLQIGIILLTLATAIIHFYLAFVVMQTFDIIFFLNGLGYLALLGAMYLPLPFLDGQRNLVRWVFIGYTLVTIIAWFIMGDINDRLAWVTKAIEVVLIVFLYMDGSRRQ